MLSKQRVKEAEVNVKSYLSDGLLKKIRELNPKIKEILITNSKESLMVAEILSNKSSLWTIVCSYYSMYYISKAVLCFFGYKVSEQISHKVTADSLIVFIKNKLRASLIEEYEELKEEALEIAGIKAGKIINDFDRERIKRGKLQYSTTEEAKKEKAKTSLERAKKFVFEMEKLMI